MPYVRRSLTLAGLVAMVPFRRASAFVLVTPEEASADRAAPPQLESRQMRDPQAPRIEVIRPDEAVTLTPPLSIALRFMAAPDARIDPASFRVRYGAIGINITERLRPHARIDADGLVADNATLPSGSHRLRMQIADTRGRIGERVFRVTVA